MKNTTGSALMPPLTPYTLVPSRNDKAGWQAGFVNPNLVDRGCWICGIRSQGNIATGLVRLDGRSSTVTKGRPMVPTISFTTGAGLRYDFNAYPKLSLWPNSAGIYLFVQPPAPGYSKWPLFYVGQTESFAQRLPFHERWDEAARRGATHVAICAIPNALQRSQIEELMIKTYGPVLNDMHKPVGIRSLLG